MRWLGTACSLPVALSSCCCAKGTTPAQTHILWPSVHERGKKNTVEVFASFECWMDRIYLLPVFHDSESVRKSTLTQMGGWMGGWVGGWGLWLVTTPLPSKWAGATGWMCVCVSTELPPAPFTSPLLLQYATDLVAKVTSCVDEFTSVLITTQQSWLKQGGWLVCVCWSLSF